MKRTERKSERSPHFVESVDVEAAFCAHTLKLYLLKANSPLDLPRGGCLAGLDFKSAPICFAFNDERSDSMKGEIQ